MCNGSTTRGREHGKRGMTRTHIGWRQTKPESSDHLHDGRPPTLGPSHDQAVASSFVGLWKLCFGPRLSAFVRDPGKLSNGREGERMRKERIEKAKEFSLEIFYC